MQTTETRTVGWQPPPASNIFLPALAGLLLLALTRFSNMDQSISAFFFEPSQGNFPLRHNFILQTLLHDWLKNAVVAFGLGLAVLAVFVTGEKRRALLFTFGAMVFASTLIALVKKTSSISCPYALPVFGGAGSSGGCWPSGHASVGYSLFACYFAARWLGLNWARMLLAIALGLGLLLTFTQTLRGEHFLSHGLWTGIFTWLINLILALIFLPRREPTQ
ncbi:MAG: hypothetical protein ACFHX7_04795 [Pseudomonadota bacterium]